MFFTLFILLLFSSCVVSFSPLFVLYLFSSSSPSLFFSQTANNPFSPSFYILSKYLLFHFLFFFILFHLLSKFLSFSILFSFFSLHLLLDNFYFFSMVFFPTAIAFFFLCLPFSSSFRFYSICNFLPFTYSLIHILITSFTEFMSHGLEIYSKTENL
ncbi:unnamed protein product [Acanthosepion pharaonis]|uniref:Uncharacterized protein n=1 Tax=Acanthosepion pharaonis TaxID=158019 RepID=A0A812DKG0_ACAPH|nr:unnamed protein product [Sepia pharaonis]